MPSIKDEALAYEPPITKNIADLDKVSINEEIVEREYTDSNQKPFKINVIVINDEDYRVPVSIVKALKDILQEKPDITSFKVVKSGTGLSTSYTLVPLD